MPQDDDGLVERWRGRLRHAGVWANDPVPLFPYPGSPDYRRLWGLPDDDAWERAVDHYLGTFAELSELQDARPRRLRELEGAPA
jgi:anaerobic magnesium-protoporphyrin IX monomethyl ester cyclase